MGFRDHRDRHPFLRPRWSWRDPRVQSVMVEVNRRLYLDEATGLPAEGFCEVVAIVQACCITALDRL